MSIFNQSVTSTLILVQNLSTNNILSILLSQNLFIIHNCNGDNTEFLDAYGTIGEANNYFDNRLRSAPWKRARLNDKMSAMREATFIIDRLNYAGQKTIPTQFHQFPRGPDPSPTRIVINQAGIPVLANTLANDPDVTIPDDIKKACFEVALKLLQGYDPDKEADLLTSNTITYSGVKTGYERGFIPDYMRAGIPSFRAWTYLRPYLRDPNELIINRV